MSSIGNKLDLIKQYLDVRVAAHSLYSSNIANSETPNYQAKVGSFKSVLEKVHSEHAPDGSLILSTEPKWNLSMKVNNSTAPSREDGNNVKIDQEMSNMSQNSILYMSAIKILNKEMAINEYAITGGR